MRRLLSIILAICVCMTLYPAEAASAETAPEFRGMDDPALLPYVEDTLYESLIEELDSSEYFVENVSAVYISQEYLDELAYNSQANIFFGYTLAELDEQFQGEKYLFTLGDDNETIVEPWTDYDDTYDRIIRNVAIGTGVILICVTVTAVTAGTGASACSMIFTKAAKAGAREALSGAFIGGVSAGIVKGMETGDMKEALKAAALEGSESFKWGAITGAVSGAAGELFGLMGARASGLTMNEAAYIQKKTKWPLKVIKNLHSIEESEVYIKAELIPVHLSDGKWILMKQIDWDLADDLGRTNQVRVLEWNLAPIDSSGLSYEVHHVGQKADGPLAMLTYTEHHNKDTYSFIHYAAEGKDITPSAWNAQRNAFWKTVLHLQLGV